MSEKITIPKIVQWEAYRYEPMCDCPDHASWSLSEPRNFDVDGYADTPYGLMLCCTCRKCGYKFKFHLRTRKTRDIYDEEAQIRLKSFKMWGCIK